MESINRRHKGMIYVVGAELASAQFTGQPQGLPLQINIFKRRKQW